MPSFGVIVTLDSFNNCLNTKSYYIFIVAYSVYVMKEFYNRIQIENTLVFTFFTRITLYL